jgi:hypothetical protein
MTDHTQLPWKWHPSFGDRNGCIYSEPHPGHAYAVAMQPRYVENDCWEADAELIVSAVNAWSDVAALRARLDELEGKS